MEDSITGRLKLFISSLKLTDSAFADSCGISRSTLSQILSGKCKKISDQLIVQLHNAYPHLNIAWLLFDEGTMTAQKEQTSYETADSNPNLSVYNPISESEIRENSINPSDQNQEAILRGLTSNQTEANELRTLKLHLEQKIRNLESEISKLHEQPRRVQKITIYYDDSTFESFVPEK